MQNQQTEVQCYYNLSCLNNAHHTFLVILLFMISKWILIVISVPGSINVTVVTYINRVSSQMEEVIEPWLFRTNGVRTIDDDDAFSATKETVEQFACYEVTLIIITIIRIIVIPNKDVSYKIPCNV